MDNPYPLRLIFAKRISKGSNLHSLCIFLRFTTPPSIQEGRLRYVAENMGHIPTKEKRLLKQRKEKEEAKLGLGEGGNEDIKTFVELPSVNEGFLFHSLNHRS